MRPLRDGSLAERMVRAAAWPLSRAYATGAWLKNSAYDLQIAKPERLSWPVVSLGNLSAGGTGKTPLVLLLAELLERCGWSADVLSRGYRRSSSGCMRVDPAGSAEEFGDEPLLMARRGLRVYVGVSRYRAGWMAEKDATAQSGAAYSRRVHLLDDGFQHRKLARAVDIVLLRRGDLEDDLLPAGRLREPARSLARADICVLRAEDADLKDCVLGRMRCGDPARVWIVERRIVLPAGEESLNGSDPALAFCAIGDPRGFFQGLRQAGIDVRAEVAFRDHHAYTRGDIGRLREAAANAGARYFLTTEKDSVRMGRSLRAMLENAGPVIVAGLAVSLRAEAGSIDTLESLLAMPEAGPLQDNRRNVR